MAITKITTTAPEKGTFGITCTFTDEDGDALTPDTLTWTLTDMDGSVINSRQDVSVSSLSSSVTITLSGDDLALTTTTSQGRKRRFAIEGTYDSDLGDNLPLTGECEFSIDSFLGVT